MEIVTPSKIELLIACSGLGQTVRGFESFAADCYAVLHDEPTLEVRLLQGGHTCSKNSLPPGEVRFSFGREGAIARLLSKAFGRDPYFWEQCSFGFRMMPDLISWRPDVVLFSDGNLGNLLWHFRRLSGLKYRLLFSNGGPLDPPFDRWDLVQQVAPIHLERAISLGVSPAKQVFLPYGIFTPSSAVLTSAHERAKLRAKLSLPQDRPILLSVGAIDLAHKRMHYVIEEVALLEPRPFLLLLGQETEESNLIREMAKGVLGEGNFAIRQALAEETVSYYRAADVFILASLWEGLARVLLEASSFGLPCFVHDYEITKFVLPKETTIGDFTVPGALAALLREYLAVPNILLNGDERSMARAERVDARFSWNSLRPQYVEMVHKAARMDLV